MAAVQSENLHHTVGEYIINVFGQEFIFIPAEKARKVLLDMLKTIFFSNNCKGIRLN